MQNQVGYAASMLVVIAFIVKLFNLHLNVIPQEIVDAILAAVVLGGGIVSAFTHKQQGQLTMMGTRKPF